MFYSLGNVEGLAFVNGDDVLEENQLLVSTEIAEALTRSFVSIFTGLKGSGRSCRGFLLKTSKYQFLGIPVPTGAVVLQLDPAQDVDEFFRQAGSIIGSSPGAPPVAPPLAQPARPGHTTSVVTSSVAVQADDGAGVGDVWEEFSIALTKALGRVAPVNLAKKLVSNAASRVLGGALVPSSLGQIYAIGQVAISAVPNAGRRKLVEKELTIIAERLNLPM